MTNSSNDLQAVTVRTQEVLQNVRTLNDQLPEEMTLNDSIDELEKTLAALGRLDTERDR